MHLDPASQIFFRCLVQTLCSLELASGDHVDPDFAIKLMESVAATLQECNEQIRGALECELEVMRECSSDPEVTQFLDRFMESFGLSHESD